MAIRHLDDRMSLVTRALRMLPDLQRDVVYAVRSLVRSPALAVALAGVMGVGIGAPVAVFCFVDAVLLRPLPYPEASRLVGVVRQFPGGTSTLLNGRIVEVLEDHVNTLEYLAVSAPSSGLTLLVAGDSHHVSTHRVSANYFRALNISPMFGRHPEPADVQVDGVILSHSLWLQHFGADPRGRRLGVPSRRAAEGCRWCNATWVPGVSTCGCLADLRAVAGGGIRLPGAGSPGSRGNCSSSGSGAAESAPRYSAAGP